MHIQRRNSASALLGYCANVHPGESLGAVLHAVRHFGAGVREQLGVPALSFGLWLNRAVLDQLEACGTEELEQALVSARLMVCTLNGFPYGNFQERVVKRRVYHPDLSTFERRTYLSSLARVLARLLPADLAEGTISTLPIGHRAEGSPDVVAAAALQLCGLCEDLAKVRDETGRSIRVCLEPEPGCWLETTEDAIRFFTDDLPRAARQSGVAGTLIAQHLGLCYDTCHQAVCFEDAEHTLRALRSAGVQIGKVQLSNALELRTPADPEAYAALMQFDEPRYLHQVRVQREDSSLVSADDLSGTAELPRDRPWRVHFHVPIHRELMGSMNTTRHFLESSIAAFADAHQLPHFEVETYTWNVLPARDRPHDDVELVEGLAAELRWARGALA